MADQASPTPVEAAPKAFGAARFNAVQATRLPLQFCRSRITDHRSRVQSRRRTNAFTLTELLVTMSVLVLLVFLFTQLLNSAATIMAVGNKRMDADSQARQLLDRMAIDFDQMLKRTDVSYYVKTGTTAPDNPLCTYPMAFLPGVLGDH